MQKQRQSRFSGPSRTPIPSEATGPNLIKRKITELPPLVVGKTNLMMLKGFTDARGFRQWQEVDGSDEKVKKAFYILVQS